LEQAAQGSGGVPISGGVQKTCSGTSGHGSADMVVLGWWLDLMILEVFSNLNDSMILWFLPPPGLLAHVFRGHSLFLLSTLCPTALRDLNCVHTNMHSLSFMAISYTVSSGVSSPCRPPVTFLSIFVLKAMLFSIVVSVVKWY